MKLTQSCRQLQGRLFNNKALRPLLLLLAAPARRSDVGGQLNCLGEALMRSGATLSKKRERAHRGLLQRLRLAFLRPGGKEAALISGTIFNDCRPGYHK